MRPADYATLAAFPDTDPAPVHVAGDRRIASFRRRIVRRLAERLVELFDALRSGTAVARGRPISNPAETLDLPADLWGSPTMVVTAAGAVSIDGVPAFVDVEIVAPRPKPRPVCRASLDKFTIHFAGEILASRRQFTGRELVVAAQIEFGATSAREIGLALKRTKPTAWAGHGRRPAALIPTTVELAQAARAARIAVESRR